MNKIKQIITNSFEVLDDEIGLSQEFKNDLDDILSVLEGNKGPNWSMPDSHHVTQLYIGGNKQKLLSDAFRNY